MATTMTWDEWIAPRRKDLTDGSYAHELNFVEKVLSQVKGLLPASVAHQIPFKDVRGGNRRGDSGGSGCDSDNRDFERRR